MFEKWLTKHFLNCSLWSRFRVSDKTRKLDEGSCAQPKMDIKGVFIHTIIHYDNPLFIVAKKKKKKKELPWLKLHEILSFLFLPNAMAGECGG